MGQVWNFMEIAFLLFFMVGAANILREGDFCIHSLDNWILLRVSHLGTLGAGLKFRNCFFFEFFFKFLIYMIPRVFDTERLKCRHLIMNLRSRRFRGSFWRFSCAFVVDVKTGCQQLWKATDLPKQDTLLHLETRLDSKCYQVFRTILLVRPKMMDWVEVTSQRN